MDESFGEKQILSWGRGIGSITIQTAPGSQQPVEDGDHEARIQIRFSRTQTFSAENDTRIQRVLDIATNKLLSERVCNGFLPGRKTDPTF